MIALVTQGSSSTDCVPVAGDASYANGVLEVELVAPPADTVCTADYVSRATLVGVPEGVDPTQDLEIRLKGGYTGDTDLDGVAGLTAGGSTDYEPSAGWADDGQFVIVTWGSSTCVPVISDVAATSSTSSTPSAYEASPATGMQSVEDDPWVTSAIMRPPSTQAALASSSPADPPDADAEGVEPGVDAVPDPAGEAHAVSTPAASSASPRPAARERERTGMRASSWSADAYPRGIRLPYGVATGPGISAPP